MGQQNTSYLTGNKKLDKSISMALEKDPSKPNRLLRVNEDHSSPNLDKWGFGTSEVKKHKYNIADEEKRTYKDGTVFASELEMKRWDYLMTLQQAGEIKELQKQIPFLIFDGFTNKQYGEIKPIYYVADFVYLNVSFRKNLEGKYIVEDSKGKYKSGLTQVFKMKKKMFLSRYPDLLFFEVYG